MAADDVISITLSDEEEEQPCKKKRKLSRPQVTISPITSKPLKKEDTVVSLDSDDETEKTPDLSAAAPETSISDIKEVKPDEPTSAVESSKNDEPITLSDDESPSDALIGSLNSNGVSLIKKSKPETVSLIDSDSETEKSSRIKKNNSDSPDLETSPQPAVVVLDDSDDEQKENHCEMADVEPFHVNSDKTKASDLPDESSSQVEPKQASTEAKDRFKKFLRLVEERIIDSSFEEVLPKKMPVIQKYFKKSGSYVNEDVFCGVLNKNIEEMKKATTSNAANAAIMAFYDVFEHLKSKAEDVVVVVEMDDLPAIKKCWKTLTRLQKKIRHLEEAEVDWDDEEDSTYILLDRYQTRFKQVYDKYCRYLRRNPHLGRSQYEKINYTISSHPVINQALRKKYKNGRTFPSHDEVKKYITKAAGKLNLSEQEITIETQKCFQFIGQTIQDRRKKDLRESIHSYADRFNLKYNEDDPATKDLGLENRLKKGEPVFKNSLDQIFEKFTVLQEQMKDKPQSESSNSVGTESDEEEIDVKSPQGDDSKEDDRSLTPEKALCAETNGEESADAKETMSID